MRIKLSQTDTYIPTWRGNRKLKGDEQIIVEYRFMTPLEEEKYEMLRPRYKGREAGEYEIDVETQAVAVWKECVIKVRNLFDDKGAELSDPHRIADTPGMYQLITEVVAQIRRGIPEDDLKN